MNGWSWGQFKKRSGVTPLESSSREHPRGEPSLAGLRGVALSRGSENGQSWRQGSVPWCHKCQIHLLSPCWARCHIPLGYGTGTSYEKNFNPLLTPRGSEGRAAGRQEVARTLQRSSAGFSTGLPAHKKNLTRLRGKCWHIKLPIWCQTK